MGEFFNFCMSEENYFTILDLWNNHIILIYNEAYMGK